MVTTAISLVERIVANCSIRPNATEYYDGVDQNCDGLSDFVQISTVSTAFSMVAPIAMMFRHRSLQVREIGMTAWIKIVQATSHDSDGDGFDSDQHGGSDCDDTQSAVSPVATEQWYDGVDGNCDGLSDYDSDLDGFDSDNMVALIADDTNAAIYVGKRSWYDGVDSDCSGTSDYDRDQDGFDAENFGGNDCNDLQTQH